MMVGTRSSRAPAGRATSRPRMVPPVHLPQPARRHVRVDLRGPDVRVPEQRLHDAEVGAPGEEMRRERVAQRMRRDAAAEAGGERTTAHELPHRLARERPPAGAEEEERARAPAQQARPLLLDVRRERRTRVASERYHALFPALAEEDRKSTRLNS